MNKSKLKLKKSWSNLESKFRHQKPSFNICIIRSNHESSAIKFHETRKFSELSYGFYSSKIGFIFSLFTCGNCTWSAISRKQFLMLKSLLTELQSCLKIERNEWRLQVSCFEGFDAFISEAGFTTSSKITRNLFQWLKVLKLLIHAPMANLSLTVGLSRGNFNESFMYWNVLKAIFTANKIM